MATTNESGNPNSESDLQKITRQVEDGVTYPILTREVDSLATAVGGTAPASGGSTSLGRVAQDTIRQVLGWRYRADDPRGFVAALSKTFQLREVEGHTEWEFKPQNYMIQADLGEITGAQASIHSRARVALEQSLPLLDGLTPLRADADAEDTAAMRVIVRTELTELVSELGVAGGPRVQRVDKLFELLLGDKPNTKDAEKVSGQLRLLRERFGLERKRVNTIGEEQNLTNFIILVDYVNSLYFTWQAQRRFFDRNGDGEPFLGTQLVLLSQNLEVIAETVQGTYAAMDSVFFGAAERQTTPLKLDDEKSSISVAELLGWVENFATVEGRQLILEAGKDGVIVFRVTLKRLHGLLEGAAKLSQDLTNMLPPGCHTRRVQVKLADLVFQTGATLKLAKQIKAAPRPSIKFAELKSNDQKHIIIGVYGESFQPGAEVRLNRPGSGTREEDKSLVGMTIQQLGDGFALAEFDRAEFQLWIDKQNSKTKGQKLTVVVLNPDDQYDCKPHAIEIVD